MHRSRARTVGAAVAALTAAFAGPSVPVHAGPPDDAGGPMIVAHRGGTGRAVHAGADAVWLTVRKRGSTPSLSTRLWRLNTGGGSSTALSLLMSYVWWSVLPIVNSFGTGPARGAPPKCYLAC
jgi:hypothetical protein